MHRLVDPQCGKPRGPVPELQAHRNAGSAELLALSLAAAILPLRNPIGPAVSLQRPVDAGHGPSVLCPDRKTVPAMAPSARTKMVDAERPPAQETGHCGCDRELILYPQSHAANPFIQ